jgi:hypothetical protein
MKIDPIVEASSSDRESLEQDFEAQDFIARVRTNQQKLTAETAVRLRRLRRGFLWLSRISKALLRPFDTKRQLYCVPRNRLSIFRTPTVRI